MSSRFVLPTDLMETPYGARLDALAGTVFTHRALDNRFYRLWRSERVLLGDFHVFAVNYFARVYATTKRISFALATIEDWPSRIALLHNLSDELGHGEKENVHVLVLYRWLDSLSKALGCGTALRQVLDESQPLPSTQNFIDRTDDLCRRSPQEAAGALLAQEWHGYTQIAYLLDGFQNYRALYDAHDFHEVCEYFYVHLGRAEKEHRVQAATIAARHCRTEEDFRLIGASFETYMDLLYQFWEGIYGRLQQADKP